MSTGNVTCASIRALKPCYDPSRCLLETYSAPLHEFLTIDEIPAADRIWVASRLAPDRASRLFAARCARRALSRVPNPDARSLAAVEAAERFARGEIGEKELAAARAAGASARAAWASATKMAAAWAAWAAAWAAAGAAAWAAAWSAAGTSERELQVLDFIEILKGDLR